MLLKTCFFCYINDGDKDVNVYNYFSNDMSYVYDIIL